MKKMYVHVKTRIICLVSGFIFLILYKSFGGSDLLRQLVDKDNFNVTDNFVVGIGAGAVAIIVILIIENISKFVYVKCSNCGKTNRGDVEKCQKCNKEITGFEKVLYKISEKPDKK